jgi:hypothetical protein
MRTSRYSITRYLRTLLVVVGAVAWSSTLMAQTTTGTVKGTVTSGGASIGSAQIQVRNAATGVQRGATTRDDGTYVLPGLPPATYQLTIRRIGSEPQTRTIIV